jgi:GNAT superfamily N-acetyltransferase
VRLGLIAELDAELNERYPGESTNGVEADSFDAAGGCFLVARFGTATAGCGAFRALGRDTVEIKRMYVRPGLRDRRVAGALLVALEQEARRRGYSRAILETGTRQPEAIALCQRHGYRPIECFGVYVGNPFSVCLAKSLDPGRS